MDAAKKKRLKEAGWKTGSVAEFLELTPEESGLIEIKRQSLRHRMPALP